MDSDTRFGSIRVEYGSVYSVLFARPCALLVWKKISTLNIARKRFNHTLLCLSCLWAAKMFCRYDTHKSFALLVFLGCQRVICPGTGYLLTVDAPAVHKVRRDIQMGTRGEKCHSTTQNQGQDCTDRR